MFLAWSILTQRMREQSKDSLVEMKLVLLASRTVNAAAVRTPGLGLRQTFFEVGLEIYSNQQILLPKLQLTKTDTHSCAV